MTKKFVETILNLIFLFNYNNSLKNKNTAENMEYDDNIDKGITKNDSSPTENERIEDMINNFFSVSKKHLDNERTNEQIISKRTLYLSENLENADISQEKILKYLEKENDIVGPFAFVRRYMSRENGGEIYNELNFVSNPIVDKASDRKESHSKIEKFLKKSNEKINGFNYSLDEINTWSSYIMEANEKGELSLMPDKFHYVAKNGSTYALALEKSYSEEIKLIFARYNH